jgi:hypothetical protein
MLLRLTITGIDQTIRGVDAAEKLYQQAIAETLEWFGKTVSEEVKADHPYIDRTGGLTRSVGYTVESWRGRFIQVNVFATMPYAEAVEYGTSRSRPYAFLFPKFYKYLGELQQRLQIAVNAALAAGGGIGGA